MIARPGKSGPVRQSMDTIETHPRPHPHRVDAGAADG
jgi:hypothetical protein